MKIEGRLSKALIEFLKLLYTPEEAQLVRHLKMGAKNLKSAAEIAKAAAQRAAPINP